MRHAAISINSQLDPRGLVDWREIPMMERDCAVHELPKEVASKCYELLKELDLQFGCVDFIVTPEEEYVFLEINEAGQFAWMDMVTVGVGATKTFLQAFLGRDIALHVDVPAIFASPAFKEFASAQILASRVRKLQLLGSTVR